MPHFEVYAAFCQDGCVCSADESCRAFLQNAEPRCSVCVSTPVLYKTLRALGLLLGTEAPVIMPNGVDFSFLFYKTLQAYHLLMQQCRWVLFDDVHAFDCADDHAQQVIATLLASSAVSVISHPNSTIYIVRPAVTIAHQLQLFSP